MHPCIFRGTQDVSIGRLQKQALRGQEAYEKTKEKYDNLASAVDHFFTISMGRSKFRESAMAIIDCDTLHIFGLRANVRFAKLVEAEEEATIG